MPVYSSSSNQRNLINADGSQNVFCYGCGEFIAKTFERIGRAQCELCRRVENGEVLTEEMIRIYKLSKGPKTDISMLLINDEPRPEGKKFSLRSLGGMIAEAIGLPKADKQAVPSAKLAKSKKRTRLFANVDLEEEPGKEKK